MNIISAPEKGTKPRFNFKYLPIEEQKVLVVKDLAVGYTKRLIPKISFEMKSCDKIVITGFNGIGKSTLLKTLVGEIKPISGWFHFSQDTKISYFEQEFNWEDDSKSPLEELGERFFKLPQSEIRKNLSLCGLKSDHVFQPLKSLSGGEQAKVKICDLMLKKSNFLILDEPTNYLDIEAKVWLEEFLLNFDNTVIVVSHDRHFLNKVCTHMLDIDYGKITLFIGNYDFWYESSQLILKQMKDSNKKKEEKIKELKDFIARFSANASKSKQATSRKKSLEKIELEEMKASSRRYPYINFEVERPLGKDVLELKGISKTIDGEVVLKNMNLTINTNDKVGFVGTNELAITTLFKIITGELEPDSGEVKWGTTVKYDYFPKNHDKFFDNNYDLIDWLRQYSKEQEEPFIRGFLGRMLFSGDEALKKVKVLSGGEKVRCMMSKLMLSGANVLVMDDPTNHLDIESITSLNKGMENFKGALLFSSHDHELLSTVANRIIEFKEDGKYIDKMMNYDEYLESVK